jgi:Ca-activated chloride channel family protein
VNFAHPAWFLLLVLLPLLGGGALAVARLRRTQWAAFVAPRLRASLLKRGSPLPRWFALLLLLAACAALIAALARPQGDAGTRTEKNLGRNVLVALDLSRSMRVSDVKPDRLTQAKMVIYELLDAMPNERIGLIGFAGTADLYAPLTVDHAAVRETVEQIDETWAPLGGSDLAAAIRLATDTLKKTGQKNNALVILSDGEKHAGDLGQMIAEAGQSGVYILAIGVGSEDGDYVPDPHAPGGRMHDRHGRPVISRLQADVMRELATETKGRFALAGTGMDIPAMVKSAVSDLDAFEMEGRERTVSIEFYQWLVLPAILFLLGSLVAGTRWRGVNPAPLALLAAGLFLLPANSRADEISEAKRALQQKQYPQAREAYQKLAGRTPLPGRKARFRIGEATAAYRGGDFRHARSAYSRALLTDESKVLEAAHLGLGSSLFQLGWLGLSGKPYAADSSQTPDLATFDALVRERLKAILEADASDASSGGLKPVQSVITNWVDAVRHYDTALATNPADKSASNNRAVTITYLKRLQELLEEHRQQTEQATPQPGEGDPQPKKPGEGDSEEDQEPQEGDGTKPSPEKDNSDHGDSDQEPKEDSEGGKQQPDKSKKAKEPKEGEKDRDPNETPEERARRILKENADLEKGPLTPGRREFRAPEKDW